MLRRCADDMPTESGKKLVSEFKIDIEWVPADHGLPTLGDTCGLLTIFVGGVCLTQNVDTWSGTVRDSVLVSAYPLATWLAASWSSLRFEPLPKAGGEPSLEWKMSHELGAAGGGYVWPKISFASDGEFVRIGAVASCATSLQSVRYLHGLEPHVAVNAEGFSQEAGLFIASVLLRLDACGHSDTELSHLWRAAQAEQCETASAKVPAA